MAGDQIRLGGAGHAVKTAFVGTGRKYFQNVQCYEGFPDRGIAISLTPSDRHHMDLLNTFSPD